MKNITIKNTLLGIVSFAILATSFLGSANAFAIRPKDDSFDPYAAPDVARVADLIVPPNIATILSIINIFRCIIIPAIVLGIAILCIIRKRKKQKIKSLVIKTIIGIVIALVGLTVAGEVILNQNVTRGYYAGVNYITFDGKTIYYNRK